jgi:membrane associated rhomboid family serine protease
MSELRAMTDSNSVRRGRRDTRVQGLGLIAILVAIMWGVEVVDLAAGDLDANGIRPRDEDGLPGILLAPFLHGGFGHLIGNTIPLVLLGGVIALGGLRRVAIVTLIVVLTAGVGTWMTAPVNTLHIGASGIVFGYISYLVIRGLYSRSILHFAAGVLVLLFWGGTLMTGLVPEQGISWQGHLFGALGGILAARLVHVEAASRRRFDSL